jgi:hypothetical protein
MPDAQKPEDSKKPNEEAKAQGAPQEKELNIDGPDIAPPAPSPKLSKSKDDSAVNVMEANIADLGSLSAPGTTTEEFLDKLIKTPQEQLIPWETCSLPSRGIYYDWPNGEVQVRAMGQAAEKILATQRLAQTGQSIDYLFRECCSFPEDFDPLNLLLGDRIFLLYYLRGITHGNQYEFAVTCPTCEEVTTHTYDLNLLASTITWADTSVGNEPFKVVLPYLTEATGRDVWVSVRFLRAADANSMIAKQKTIKKATARPGQARNRLDPRQQQQESHEIDQSITDNLEKIIMNVMGVDNPFTIKSFINKLHATDTASIREWLRENTPGIDTTVALTCSNCDGEFTVELPISESFFRPTKPERIRT